METNFNGYKDTYKLKVDRSISFAGQGLDFYTKAKAGHLIRLAERYFGKLDRLRVLDVGCGVGETDYFLASRFAELHGVDIAEGVLSKAVERNPSGRYHLYDGYSLPFKDQTFDLTFAICVMHHVPPANWKDFVFQMQRVTKKDGLIAIFEHNPFNPLTQLAVDRCEFDVGANLLKMREVKELLCSNGLNIVDKRYILFFPWQGAIFAKVEDRLKRLPLGAQFYIAGQKTL